MNCIHCQGSMNWASAHFHVDRRGYHLSLDSVPAWVCSQCGEPYFEVKEVEAIQRVLVQLDEQTAAMTTAA